MCVGIPAAPRAPGLRVWDLPLRLVHWSLAALVVGALVSQKLGGNAMVWHGRCGLAILGLLVFRLAWGLVGSSHARFKNFVRGPAAIRAYLRGEWQGVGHNPLGALAVLAMLSVLAALALSGLFANDDIAFQGPLYPLVGSELSSRITGWHQSLEPVLVLIVLLHIAAIAFYIRVRRQNLLKPMLTGWQNPVPPTAEPTRGGGAMALLLAIGLALLAVWAASGSLLLLPAPPPAAAPTW